MSDGNETSFKFIWIPHGSSESGLVPDDWTKTMIVPLYKGEGSKSYCKNYRGSLGILYNDEIVIDRVKRITEPFLVEEQGGIRKEGRRVWRPGFCSAASGRESQSKRRKCTQYFMDL